MRQLLPVIFLIVLSCTNPGSRNEPTQSDAAAEVREENQTDNQSGVHLKDTVFNKHSVKFNELTHDRFDSLRKHSRRTELSLQPAHHKFQKADSCFIIKYHNQKTDSLCNWDDGEQFEKYSIKGLWNKNDLLLISFQNWEESHDFFLNLNDGSYHILTPYYEISPSQDKVLTYVDITEMPIYSSELMIRQILNGEFTTLYKKDLGETTITDAKWISDSECILATGVVDSESNEIKDRKWYRVVIE